MKKTITVLTLSALLFALGLPADAQQQAKVPRIGFLDNSTAAGSAVLVEAFRQELSKLGWIEGKNITIEYRFAEGKNERLPELVADLIRLKVDLVVVSGTQLCQRPRAPLRPLWHLSAAGATYLRPGGPGSGAGVGRS